VAVNQDATFVARGMPLSVWRWDGSAYQPLAVPDLGDAVITSLAFSADGRLLVVATADGWLHFLEAQ
jgi:hypothetical protein